MITTNLFSSYVGNVVFASEAKQSHSTSFINEIASATPRNDRFYSKKPEQLREMRMLINIALLSSFLLLKVANADVTNIHQACSNQESWSYSQSTPYGQTKSIQEFLALMVGSDIALEQAAQGWVAMKTLPFARSNGDKQLFTSYAEARLLLSVGYGHSAYEHFESLLISSVSNKSPAARTVSIATLECLNRIALRYPTFNLNTDTERALEQHADLFLNLKDKTLISMAGLNLIRHAIDAGDTDRLRTQYRLLAQPQFAEFAQLLVALKLENQHQIELHGARFVALSAGRSPLSKYRGQALVAVGAAYAQNGDIDQALAAFKRVSPNSNYYPTALSDYGALLHSKDDDTKAVSVLLKLQMGGLTRTFQPRAHIELAESMGTLCHFPEARYIFRQYGQRYGLLTHRLEQIQNEVRAGKESYYSEALKLNHTVGDPKASVSDSIIFLEWMRSPRTQAYQKELNLFIDEAKMTELDRKQWKTIEVFVKSPYLPTFERLIAQADPSRAEYKARQISMQVEINSEIESTTSKMVRSLSEIYPQLELVRAEILRGAGSQIAMQDINSDDEDSEQSRGVSAVSEASLGISFHWEKFALNEVSTHEVWKDEQELSSQIVIENICPKKK
jgi:tetratricopeptide (TPR) repeat protein